MSALSENTPLLRLHDDLYAKKTRVTPNVREKYIQEAKILACYLLPTFGAQVLEFSLVTVSVISIGHESTTALSAISLGTLTANVTAFSVIQGFVTALDTMLPSAWTSSQPQLVGLWAQRMCIVMSFLLIPIYFLWFNMEPVLLFLKQQPDVAHLTSIYLRWLLLGLPAYTFNSICRRYFQCQGYFSISTKIISIAAFINVILNYALVWGPSPIRLGFIGAPIATVVSLNLAFLMFLVYGIWYLPRTAWCPPSRRMFLNHGILIKLGMGGAGTSLNCRSEFKHRLMASFDDTAQMASEWCAWELVALAASWMGPVALTSQSVILTSSSALFQVFIALSLVTSIRIGNLLGEGNASQAEIVTRIAMLLALAISIVLSIVFVAFRVPWAYVFNSDPDVAAMVATIIPFVAVFQIFDANAVLVAGILRARGKQVFGAFLNLSAYYLIGLPLGIFFAIHFGLEVRGLWLGLTFALVYCAGCGTIVCLHTDWEAEAWKTMARIKAERGVRTMLDEQNV